MQVPLRQVEPPSASLLVAAGVLLVRMLVIHIDVAVTERLSSGDWTAYAADVSRRWD